MSPPFFSNPSFLSWGYFFIGTPCSQACPEVSGLGFLGSPPLASLSRA